MGNARRDAAARPPPRRRRVALTRATSAGGRPPLEEELIVESAVLDAGGATDAPVAALAGASASSGSDESLLQWQVARQLIHEQQVAAAEAAAQPGDLARTQQLVETAMLAAVAGLAFTVATLLKLESYLAYVLPLPVVVAALRSGAGPALKTVTTAFLLLFILTGPVRAATYLLVYGLLSLALGAAWAWRASWALSIPAAALVRIAGYAAYVQVSSWALGENLAALMVANAHALLDQLSASLGTSGAPSPAAVVVTLASLLFVHSLFYVSLLHVLYAILLAGLGLDMGYERLPGFVRRMVGAPPGGGAGLAG